MSDDNPHGFMGKTYDHDPNGIPQHEPGAKNDADKPELTEHMREFWPHVRHVFNDHPGIQTIDAWWGKYNHVNNTWSSVRVTDHRDACCRSAMEYGAKKYTPGGWKHVPDAQRRYTESATRHLLAVLKLEHFDPESHLPHIQHFWANIYFLRWFAEHGSD